MLLTVENLTAGYGARPVIRDISLDVGVGEIVAVIGPNGAGKSTVLRAIAGEIAPTKGRIVFDGREISGRSCAENTADGLIFVPQGRNVFDQMSLRENLELGGHQIADNRQLKERIERVLDIHPWMRARQHGAVHALSGGQRQRLALARIDLLDPALVLLDEPSLGLAPDAVGEIFSGIRAMGDRGVSVLLVEQNAAMALAISVRGYVLEQGENRLTGKGGELAADPRVQRLYLGG